MAFRLNYQMKVTTNFYNLFYHKILKINIHMRSSMTPFLGYGSGVHIIPKGFLIPKKVNQN